MADCLPVYDLFSFIVLNHKCKKQLGAFEMTKTIAVYSLLAWNCRLQIVQSPHYAVHYGHRTKETIIIMEVLMEILIHSSTYYIISFQVQDGSAESITIHFRVFSCMPYQQVLLGLWRRGNNNSTTPSSEFYNHSRFWFLLPLEFSSKAFNSFFNLRFKVLSSLKSQSAF